MTEKILRLKQYQWSKAHHAIRQAAPQKWLPYRDLALSPAMRTAQRLKTALMLEQPFLFPEEIIAFTRTISNLPMIYSDEEWRDIRGRHTIHELGNVCNLSPGYETVIVRGLTALRDLLGDSDYYRSMAVSIDAVLDLTARYRRVAELNGDTELAQVLARVPAQGATSFREALQSLRILHYAMWCEGDYHNTLGRFDQYMYPYLAHDLECNTLSQEQALELLEAFFLSCNRDSDLYPGMQQGDNGQSLVLGGITPDGYDGWNTLSEMCLKASEELRLIDPKINVRVNQNTPLEIFETGTRLTRLGLGFPQYENDDVVIPGLVALGYSLPDARDYAMAACWEYIIPGKGMDIPNIGALPFAGVVQDVLRRLLDKCSHMAELLAFVEQKIFSVVRREINRLKNLYIIPSPYLSLFFDGCLEQEKDISLGCKYNNWGLHGTGLAPAADMLAAVEETVFQKRTVKPEVLLSALDANYKGYDELRDQLKRCPKMGNDDDHVDKFAVWLLDIFARAVKGVTNERGGVIRAGTGSAMYYIWHAKNLGATADGRTKDIPLPANYAPSLNVRLNGPVSLIKSFTKPDLEQVINGGPLTIEFADSVFNSEESITKVAQLVQLFIRRGGHQLQLNTVNRDRLLDAQRHPEAYRNLIVRVWGWSGYFVELDKCYQDHIISRTELSV